MYDHIGLKVGNLDASVRFYTAVLAPLGYVLCSRDETGAGFGPKGEPALWLYLHKGPAAGARRRNREPRPRPARARHRSECPCGWKPWSVSPGMSGRSTSSPSERHCVRLGGACRLLGAPRRMRIKCGRPSFEARKSVRLSVNALAFIRG